MRVNPEPLQQHLVARRRSAWILGSLAGLAIAVVVVQGLASFYVNYLWFGSANVGVVWRAIVTSKLGLAGVFVTIAMALVWSSLWLADKIAQRTLFLPAESELVRRYHAAVLPHAFVLRTAVALLVALALGTGTSSQWEHWLLFRHAFSFDISDPEFHRDASFYVFRLPFLSFLVDWLLVALLVTFVISVVAHFLNGTIRVQGPAHVEPRAIAHLSLLLGVMALVRAWAYYYVDRFALEVPHNGGVAAGSTYTGIAVRLPAITLLAVISLIAFVMLVINVYQRTLLLPLLAFGLWALIALVIEVVYPAVESAVAAAPTQNGRAVSYVTDNVRMTRTGMGITKVITVPFPANDDLTRAVLGHYTESLDDVTLWDPSQAQSSLSQTQGGPSYDLLSGLSANRYLIDGKLQPVLIGARQLDDGQLPSQQWLSLHVIYTHGYGAVIAAANRATTSGTPVVALGNLPQTSTQGAPSLTKAGSRIYFSPAGRQFVLVDTKQTEIDYQLGTSTQYAPQYGHGAAIGIGGFLPRLAFAVKLRDFNLLVSDVVTTSSKVIYLTAVRARVQKALPFMKIDSNPYAVVADDQLYWVYAAYVTSSYFPDAAPADTGVLPAGSGLSGDYDYVRNAVVAVVNATSGSMNFFDVNNDADPLLESYKASFPGLIQSTAALRRLAKGQVFDHLRYPQDLLSVQAAMFGIYHPSASSDDEQATSAAAPASSGASWSLADSGDDNGSSASGGSMAATSLYEPQYELVQWQDDVQPTYSLIEPLVPYSGPSGTGGPQTLSALLVANSSPEHYGELSVLDVDTSDAPGPAIANHMLSSVNQEIGNIAANGATVSYGAIEMLPVADSLLYVRPLYLTTAGSSPVVADVVVVYGKQVVVATSLAAALARIVHGSVSGISVGRPVASTPVTSRAIRRYLQEATADFSRAHKALLAGDLGAYEQDNERAERAVDAANRLDGGSGSASGTANASRRSSKPNQASKTSSAESAGGVPGLSVPPAATGAQRRGLREEAAGSSGVKAPLRVGPLSGLRAGSVTTSAATATTAAFSSTSSTTPPASTTSTSTTIAGSGRA